MFKTTLFATIASGALLVSGTVWAQDATTAPSGQTPMMNNSAPAMQNGAMQQPMATSPSANGSGTLKDSAEAKKQMMQQQNTNQ